MIMILCIEIKKVKYLYKSGIFMHKITDGYFSLYPYGNKIVTVIIYL